MRTLPPRGRRHSDRLVVRESDVSGDCYRDPRIGRVLWTYGPVVQLCDSFVDIVREGLIGSVDAVPAGQARCSGTCGLDRYCFHGRRP